MNLNEKLIPLRGRVVVKPTQETTTTGGLIVPSKSAERSSKGTVISIGIDRINPNGELIPTILTIGDNVLFNKFSGVEIEYEGEKYFVMTEDEILLIIK